MSGHPGARSRLSPRIGLALVYGALALLAIAAIVLAAFALTPRRSTASADGTSPISVPKITEAVFIGDSYTEGAGASGPSGRWVTLVALKEGWEPDNLGRSGTGYLATGTTAECGLLKCPNYGGIVSLAVAARPDFVIVSGGESDFEVFLKNPQSVIAAIDATYNSLRIGLPDTPIYAIGPSTTGQVTKSIVAFDTAVHTAANRIGATYVSLLEPNVIKPTFIATDGVHVNDAGHAAIAARVEQSIKK